MESISCRQFNHRHGAVREVGMLRRGVELPRIFHQKKRSFVEPFMIKGFAPTKNNKRACQIVTKLNSSFRA